MNIIEDKQLRQYVHHELRTHLTVIKGNVELLNMYYCSGNYREKQILTRILEHVKDIEIFLERL